MRRIIIIGILLIALSAVVWTALTQVGGDASAQPGSSSSAALISDFDLSWHTVDGGGGESAGGPFALAGTIGQHDAGGEMTDGDGNFSLSGGFWRRMLCGDHNDDESVNVQDVVTDLRIVVGLTEPTQTQRILGDLDRNGAIDLSDAIMKLQHIVGLLPAPTPCGLAPTP